MILSTDHPPTWASHTFRRDGDSGSNLHVAVADGRERKDDRTFCVVQGFQSWIEQFEMQRFHLLARVLDARLIVVEVPGFGVAGSRLSLGERRALLNGDFGPLATRMFEAACSVLDKDEVGQSLSFLGYSMGASVAAAMMNTAATQGWKIDELVLVEPVALHRWKLRELVTSTAREDRWIGDYIATNDAVEGLAAPWKQRPGVRPATNRRIDLLILGSALRHGGLAKELHDANPGPKRVVVVRGDRSVLSGAAYSPILTTLRQRAIATAEITVPGHHAFWHSLPAVEEMAQHLHRVFDCPA